MGTPLLQGFEQLDFPLVISGYVLSFFHRSMKIPSSICSPTQPDTAETPSGECKPNVAQGSREALQNLQKVTVSL